MEPKPPRKSTSKQYIITEGTIAYVPSNSQVFIPGLSSCTGVVINRANGDKICAPIVAIPYGEQLSCDSIAEKLITTIKQYDDITSVSVCTPEENSGYLKKNKEIKGSNNIYEELQTEAMKKNINFKEKKYDNTVYMHFAGTGQLEIYDRKKSEEIEKQELGKTAFEITRSTTPGKFIEAEEGKYREKDSIPIKTM